MNGQEVMRGYHRGFVAAGLIVTIASFLFIFPYIGYFANRQYENVTARPGNVTGLDPWNPLNLVIFVVLFSGGIGLLVKGFT